MDPAAGARWPVDSRQMIWCSTYGTESVARKKIRVDRNVHGLPHAARADSLPCLPDPPPAGAVRYSPVKASNTKPRPGPHHRGCRAHYSTARRGPLLLRPEQRQDVGLELEQHGG